MTAGEVLKIVMADRAFYAASGGGVTISGGEPLLQPDFTETLLRLAKQQGLHTCIETSGAVSFDIFERIRPYVDLFLFDVKETDTENHFRYTGVSNQLLLENLRKLDALGSAIQLRCPIIPGVNDLPRHFEQLKQLYASLVHAVGIQLMPYHALGQGKTSRFGVEDAHRFPVPTAEQINTWNQLIHSETTIKG